jgi:hypothetical protein
MKVVYGGCEERVCVFVLFCFLRGGRMHAFPNVGGCPCVIHGPPHIYVYPHRYTDHLALAVHLGLTTEAAVDSAIKRLYDRRASSSR